MTTSSDRGVSLSRRPRFDVADKLVKARETAGMDQEQLAGAAHISRATISNYERRITAPKRNNLLAIAMATGVDLDWLIGDDGGDGGAGPLPAPPLDEDVVRRQGLEPRTR